MACHRAQARIESRAFMESSAPPSTTLQNAAPDADALRRMEDGALVALAQQGVGEAFAELVHRHENQIYRLALRMMRNEHDAEEVLQEALLHAYQKIDGFRGDAAFSSWIYRIAANSALMRLRRKRRAPEFLAIGEPGAEVTGPEFSSEGAYVDPPRSDWSLRADEALQNQQLGEAIRKAVENLSEDYRVVFMLKDVDGLSNEEIAGVLGLSVPAVKSRLHRARLVLRDELSGFFQVR